MIGAVLEVVGRRLGKWLEVVGGSSEMIGDGWRWLKVVGGGRRWLEVERLEAACDG
jgi:hypothetical protein